ncbi:Cys-knot domain-containing protein [Aphelenchoides fujianensis]|nr:Cys-knot domain-containing protein [Aphelenchoides fujianensis]
MSKTLVVLGFLLLLCACSLANARDTCIFDMQRIPQLNPLVLTDRNGRSCRGDILLPFCRGFCKTQEAGIHTFPYKERMSAVCSLLGNKQTNVSLSDCDEGADPSVRFVTISASTECGCRELHPQT